MIIIIIINIALFSYSFIALYNDCANVKTKKNTEVNQLQSLKNINTSTRNKS